MDNISKQNRDVIEIKCKMQWISSINGDACNFFITGTPVHVLQHIVQSKIL